MLTQLETFWFGSIANDNSLFLLILELHVVWYLHWQRLLWCYKDIVISKSCPWACSHSWIGHDFFWAFALCYGIVLHINTYFMLRSEIFWTSETKSIGAYCYYSSVYVFAIYSYRCMRRSYCVVAQSMIAFYV